MILREKRPSGAMPEGLFSYKKEIRVRPRLSSHKSPVQYARQYVMDIPGDAGGLVNLISLQLTSLKKPAVSASRIILRRMSTREKVRQGCLPVRTCPMAGLPF
jgi:hypothetical protein